MPMDCTAAQPPTVPATALPPALDAGVGSPRTSEAMWFLVGQNDEQGPMRYVPIHTTPFRIGRRTDLSLCLASRTVSGTHAEVRDEDDDIWLHDLQSTNGTYLNGARVRQPAKLQDGDLVQFADVSFRVRKQRAETSGWTVQADVCDRALALVQFDKLMSQRAVIPYFQPIVQLPSHSAVGFEILGRSNLIGLESPAAMFHAAAQMNLEIELSRMLRWEGVQVGATFEEKPHLFVNTHPAEMSSPGLIESLSAVRAVNPSQEITLEVHEASITDLHGMAELRSAMRDLKITLAYDDFGAGQARLVELAEVPPEYLKFDISLVHGIHRASTPRQQMLATLVRMVRDLGITPLAEGVECAEEDHVCRQMGFALAQGYLYGKPVPARSTGLSVKP